ncbi:MAG: hypothetical protein IM592_11290 [Bacteroidetes bacterium]|nr:hypothetical protein [Bacteroidota bacterium]
MSDDLIIGGQEMSDMLDREWHCREVFEELNKTKKELEVLQDAIVECNLHILLEDFDEDLDFVKTLNSAIQASHNRRKNNEQL